MKKMILIFCALLLLLGTGISEGAPADEFSVLSFSPSGVVKGRTPVKIAFSQPAVSRDIVGKQIPAAKYPVSFSPSIRGDGKWTDSKTFVLTPLANLPQATLFRATIKDDIRDLKGRRIVGKQVYEFSTEALKLLAIQQSDYTENGSVILDLSFNLPVSPFRLRGFLWLQNEKKQGVAYSLQGNAPSSRIQIAAGPYYDSKIGVVLTEGLTSDAGPLGIEKEIHREIPVTRKMEIRGAYASSNYPDPSGINITTSIGPDMASAAKFIELSPKMPFTVEPGYNGFSITGDFKPRQRVEVTIRKGFPSRDGAKLEKDYSKAVIFPDMYPTLLFPTAGTFLSPAGDLKIPIETVNIEEVSLSLWRVYENNIPLAMTLSGYTIPRDLARRIASRTARPEGALNSPVRRAIDLRELAGATKGVFLLTASDASGEYWGESEQLVAVTDLGIAARVAPAGITVWVNTILGMKPVAGAAVRVYSKSNQLLASGETDENGLWTWNGKEPWDSQLQPALATVEKGDDLSFLKLEGNLLADNGFDTGGRPWNTGYDALVFAPRGVFRPGEKVDFTTVVRDSRRLPPEPFPVVYTIRSSIGREVTRGTAMLSPQGMASFSTTLAPASPTGTYTATVAVPGGENTPLGRTEFFVEDFVAPRLEVKAESDKPFLAPGEKIEISIMSSYLFGAPAAGLPFEGEIRASSVSFQPEGWKAFTFGDPEKKFEPVVEFLGDGKLDESGRGSVSFSSPEGWSPPASISLLFHLRVMEESGRWVSTTLRRPMHPYPVYIGIEKPSSDAVPGKETSVRVAAVTPEGQASGTGSVIGELFLVRRHYNLVRVENQTRMQMQTELIPQFETTVPLKEGTGTFSFTPRSWGEYVIRFSDADSGSSASASMYAWAPYGMEEAGGSSLIDRIIIKADREKYAPGETASVTFRSPFAGNMLVTVDTDRELFRKVISLDRGEVTLEIPVTGEMIPNAYVSASVIRPVVEGEAWGSHRAIGTLSLSVEESGKKLSVSLETPDRIQPKETLNVKGIIRDGAGNSRKGEVSLFFVDEGILSLTGYSTPDPWGFFMAKRALGLSVYDMYDQLLPLESRTTPLLKTGGGEGEDAMAALRAGLSPVAARSFLLLSIFAGHFTTDESGVFSAELKIPEFSGKGRLMAVAASEDAFGMGQKHVTIVREITTELSLPRAVSPGDDFYAPLKIFSGADGPRKCSVTITAKGPITLTGKREFIADFTKIGDEALFNARFTAGPEAGTAYLSVVTEWNGGTFSQELDLPVRPAYPRIALSGSGIVRKDAEAKVDIPRNWFRGTGEGKLVLSDLPALDLLGPSMFLMTYPYGCLEQTVSGAWPLLVLPGLAQEIDPALVNRDEQQAALALRIRQIGAMQLYHGAFAAWPGNSASSPWASVYASHFLVEAGKNGADVPEDLLKGALSYVRQLLPLMPNDEREWTVRENMTLKAYASYVLALAGEPPLGWMAHISEHTSSLRPSGAVFLAGAYALSSGTSEPLKSLGTSSPALREGDITTLESVSRTDALKLLMWAEVDPLSAPAAALAEKLISQARKQAWSTTQDNAMGVLALGKWIEKTKGARKPFTAVLKDQAGNEVASFFEGQQTSLGLHDIPDGALFLSLTGEGTAYYAWTSAGVPEQAPAASSSGVSISRSWKNRKGDSLEPGAALERGERIEVTIKIIPAGAVRDLVVTDMLPGGMEIENIKLSGGTEQQQPARTYGVRAEMRDDRLLLFIDYMDRPLEYKYLLRAVSRGTFTLPPLAAEGMYAPDINAVTPAGKAEIR